MNPTSPYSFIHSQYGTFSIAEPKYPSQEFYQLGLAVLNAQIMHLVTLDAKTIEAMPPAKSCYKMILASSRVFLSLKALNPSAISQFVLLNQRFNQALGNAVKNEDFEILSALWANVIQSDLAEEVLMLCLYQNKPSLLEKLLSMTFFKEALRYQLQNKKEHFLISIGSFLMRYDANLGTDIIEFCSQNEFLNQLIFEQFPREISEKLVLHAYGFNELSELQAIELALAL